MVEAVATKKMLAAAVAVTTTVVVVVVADLMREAVAEAAKTLLLQQAEAEEDLMLAQEAEAEAAATIPNPRVGEAGAGAQPSHPEVVAEEEEEEEAPPYHTLHVTLVQPLRAFRYPPPNAPTRVSHERESRGADDTDRKTLSVHSSANVHSHCISDSAVDSATDHPLVL